MQDDRMSSDTQSLLKDEVNKVDHSFSYTAEVFQLEP